MKTVTFTNKEHRLLVGILRSINNPHGSLMAEVLTPMSPNKRWEFREMLVKVVRAEE